MIFTTYAGMDIGRDNGGVVDLAYEDKAPYAFTGTIKQVVFDLKPHLTARTREGPPPAPDHRGGRARNPRMTRLGVVAARRSSACQPPRVSPHTD